MNKYEAQRYVNNVTARMLEAGFPVEAAHKANHTESFIPADHFVWGSGDKYDEENLARILIGGWSSKSALIQLFVIIRKLARGGSL